MSGAISVAGIAWREDRILVMHRLPGGSVGGLWEFPGGKVDAGETPRDALVREWMEETGFSIKVGRELARGGFVHKSRRVQLIAYEVLLPDDAVEPELIDHDEWQWATLEEIGRLPLVESDLTVLAALRPGN